MWIYKYFLLPQASSHYQTSIALTGLQGTLDTSLFLTNQDKCLQLINNISLNVLQEENAESCYVQWFNFSYAVKITASRRSKV